MHRTLCPSLWLGLLPISSVTAQKRCRDERPYRAARMPPSAVNEILLSDRRERQISVSDRRLPDRELSSITKHCRVHIRSIARTHSPPGGGQSRWPAEAVVALGRLTRSSGDKTNPKGRLYPQVSRRRTVEVSGPKLRGCARGGASYAAGRGPQ